MTWLPDAVRWYLTLVAVTWALAPIARLACGRLADRGAFVARPIALLALIWPNWFLASVSPIPYATAGLWITTAVLGAVGWGLLLRSRQPLRTWIAFLIAAEGVSLVAYAGYAILRGYAPNMSGTEKPMETAFFAANRRATDMPPADPWMAGEKINYYYLGYTIHGSLARMSGVPTWVAFNLALATTFAMTIAASAGLGFNAARAWLGQRIAIAAGALSAFLIVIAGNMRPPARLLEHPSQVWHASWWQGIGWQSSRIVVDAGSQEPHTINEFPSFSFILGDLHPHVLALPFTLVALALALNLLLIPRDFGRPAAFLRWPGLALAGALIGSLYPLNSWDFPTYLVAALLALFVSLGWRRRTLIAAGIVVSASVLAWAPFIVTFVPFAGGDVANLPSGLRNIPLLSTLLKTLGVYPGPRTSAAAFLTVFGLPWLVSVIYLAARLTRRDGGELRIPRPWAIGAGVIAVTALAWPAPVLILAGAPFAAAVWLLWRDRDEPAGLDTIIGLLLAAGFVLILATEFFYLQDAFHGRMNTLFKIYYQAWTLMGAASALAIVVLWRRAKPSLAARTVLLGAVAIAIVAGLTYPVISERAWMTWGEPRTWHGLDGAAFIAKTSQGDLDAIHWLATNAKPNDVVLEAPGCAYQVNSGYPTSGLAAFTGVPTLIGWDGHEGQWRGGQPELERQIPIRADDAAAIYADPSSPLVEQYNVTLLFVGVYEINGVGKDCEIAGPYPAVQEPNYPGPGWTLAFESNGSRIYRKTS